MLYKTRNVLSEVGDKIDSFLVILMCQQAKSLHKAAIILLEKCEALGARLETPPEEAKNHQSEADRLSAGTWCLFRNTGGSGLC